MGPGPMYSRPQAQATTWRIWWTATIVTEASSPGAAVSDAISEARRSYGSVRVAR